MKNFRIYMLCFFAIFAFSGCEDDTSTDLSTTITSMTYQLILFDDDQTIIDTFENLNLGDSVTLPEPAKDGFVFTGWIGHEDVYYDEIIVQQDLSLTARYEQVDLVFDYTVNETDHLVVIDRYQGQATYLRLPSHIDGYAVDRIGYKAFENSSLKKILIHNNVSRIEQSAFTGSEHLLSIGFYGEIDRVEDVIISHTEYLSILSDYSDSCTIVSGSEEEGFWVFSEGCPITEVTHVTEAIWVDSNQNGQQEDDELFRSYSVSMALRFLSETYTQRFDAMAFSGLPSLTFLSLSKYPSYLTPYRLLHMSDNLREINVDDENPYFSSEDGILYNKDKTTLIYYPPAKEIDHYIVPRTVTRIIDYAFANHQTIEEITLHDALFTVSAFSFSEMRHLQEIYVDQDNPMLLSLDGVLYYQNSLPADTLTLVKYPPAKTQERLVLPENVTDIGPRAFEYSMHLKEIEFNQGLEVIADQAFAFVEQLILLDIPSSVLTLGRQLIKESSVETLIIRRDISYGSITKILSPVDPAISVYVPNDSYSNYYEDQTWMFSRDRLYPMSQYQPQ